MSAKTILMDDQLLEYLRKNSLIEPDVLRELREETTETSQFRNANLSRAGPADVNTGQTDQCPQDC